jgi:tRNA threonylcarbamoyladenosine biosynthesis protein TsaB
MDARRNQVYSAVYDCDGEVPKAVCGDKARSIEELAECVNALERNVIFLGDGVEPNREYLEKNITCGFRFAPAHLNLQRAGSLLAIGAALFEKEAVSGEELEIEYLRMSQAERVRMEQTGEKVIEKDCINVESTGKDHA